MHSRVPFSARCLSLETLRILVMLLLVAGAAFLTVPAAGAADAFTTTGSMSRARTGHTATLLQNGKVLVAGGQIPDSGALETATAELYDPATGQWSATGTMVNGHLNHTAVLLMDGRVLVAGGMFRYEAEIYDPVTETWTVTGMPVHSRNAHTATLLTDGRVLVAGGFGEVKGMHTVHKSAEIYDPALGTWQAVTPMASSRRHHTATRLPDGRVMMAGGTWDGTVTVAPVEIFDPVANAWGDGGSLSTSRAYHTATLLPGGKVLVTAGTNIKPRVNGINESRNLNSAELYDPASNSWSLTGPLKTARNLHSAALLPDGRVLVSPGSREDQEPPEPPNVEIYDPATAQWTVAAQPLSDRCDGTATLLPGGRVLLAGGTFKNLSASGGRTYLSTAEIYTYAAPSREETGYLVTNYPWIEGPSRWPDRYGPVTLLANGKVLMAGGETRYGTAVSSAEIYDPVSGKWTGTGLLKERRLNHRLTLLTDGRVLASGGLDEQRGMFPHNPDPGAEIYDPSTGSWKKTAQPLRNRIVNTATLLPNGKVLVTGGIQDSLHLDSTEIYDPAMDVWSAGSPMPAPRAGHSAVLLANGRVLVTGGYSGSSDPNHHRAAWLYDPFGGGWSSAGSTQEIRAAPITTLLPSGKVLVTNGTVFDTPKKPEIYDPSTNSWSFITAPPDALEFSPPVLMPDGRLYLTGGYDPLTSWEILEKSAFYDPATGKWEMFSTGGLPAYPLSPLPDGRILLCVKSDTVVGMSLFDPGYGFPAVRRPVITSAVFDSAGRLVVSGTGFRGDSGGSGGNAPDSPSDYPSVQLRRIDNGQTLMPPPDPSAGWSATSFTSGPLTGFPLGHVMVTVFVNGIPSVSSIISIPSPELRVERAGTGVELTSGTAADFGELKPGNSAELSFVIKNTGDLTLNGLAVTFSGPHAGLFTLASAPAASVPGPGPDDSTTFTVRFSPDLPGAKSAVLHLASTDPDENPFILSLTGYGLNTAPVVSGLVDTAADEDGQAVVPFAATDAETPGGLALSATSSNPALLPDQGIVFGGTGAERTVTLTPRPDRSGSATVTVTANDGALESAAVSFTLTVHPVNDPPTLNAIDAVTVQEDAGAWTVILAGLGAGPEESGQPLTVTAISSNPALIPDPAVSHDGASATGTLTFTPAPDVSGTATVTVRVTDGQALNDTLTRSFVVTVLPVNDPPTLDVITGPAPVPEDSGALTVNLTGLSAGPGESGQPLTVTAVSSQPALIPHPVVSHTSPAATGTLTLTPALDASGTAVITVMVSDGQSAHATVSRSFTVTVTPVNDPPTLTAITAPGPLRENGDTQRVNVNDVSPGEGDAEPVTLTAVSGNPGLIPHPVVTYSPFASSGYLEFTPAPDRSGAAVITVTADDGQGGPGSTVRRTFTVRVLPLIRGEAAAEVSEGNGGVTPLRFRISISDPQPEAVTVNYTTTAGTAQAGSDFTAASGTSVIAAGETETFVEVEVSGDADFEADETVELALSTPAGAFLQNATLTGIIQNDDAQPALALIPGSVTEGASGGPFQVWVKASLGAPSTLPLSWTVATRAGTAVEGVDFKPLEPVTLTFAPGETVKWAVVEVLEAEAGGGESGDEEFYLDFTPRSGPASVRSATCVIRQLTVREFTPLGQGVFALRFPTGTNQSYVIEEADQPHGPWTSNSALLFGTGNIVTQVVYSDKPRVFFRVNAAPQTPGTAAVGP